MMRKIFYFLFILLYACVAVDLSAQQMNSNIKFRSNKTIKTIKGYYAPRFETGGGYNVLTFDDGQRGGVKSNIAISSNEGNRYYRSYGVQITGNHSVVYNAPMQVDRYSVPELSREPFEDVEVASQMRVGREDTPDDPSVPIGDGVLPLLIFVLLWIVYKKS